MEIPVLTGLPSWEVCLWTAASATNGGPQASHYTRISLWPSGLQVTEEDCQLGTQWIGMFWSVSSYMSLAIFVFLFPPP